jgi:hypothetical protein
VFDVAKDDMDLNDPQFWMKVFTNTSVVIKLQEMLKYPLLWSDSERKEILMQEMSKLIEDLQVN